AVDSDTLAFQITDRARRGIRRHYQECIGAPAIRHDDACVDTGGVENDGGQITISRKINGAVGETFIDGRADIGIRCSKPLELHTALFQLRFQPTLLCYDRCQPREDRLASVKARNSRITYSRWVLIGWIGV